MPLHAKKVGFLVHARGLEDFLIKYSWLRFLPKSLLLFMTKRLPPIVVSKITGLKGRDGADVPGLILGIPMTARQMIEDRKAALGKIRQAVRLAEKKGIGIIGLGALTASFSRGGLDVSGATQVGVTTGRAYTVKNVTDYVKHVASLVGLKRTEMSVAIVGGAGAIGSGCAKVLTRWGVRNFLLVDLERKADHLKSHAEHMTGEAPETGVVVSHRVGDIKGYDIVIAATNAPEVVIRPEDLDPGTIVVNDAQPSDISPEVLDRDDVLVVEGGVIRTPGIRCNFNLGLAGREDTFCCLGEALILAHNGHFEDYALGELDLSLIDGISSLSNTMDIGMAKPQNSRGIIADETFERMRRIIADKKEAKALLSSSLASETLV